MGTSAWRRRRLTWIATCLLVLVLPAIALVVAGSPVPPADGPLLGGWVLIAAFGTAEILMPTAVLRWRQKMIEGGPATMRGLGAVFDGAFQPLTSTVLVQRGACGLSEPPCY